ncbi:hypothetical protein [Vibrio aerogenes]|uniref:hypothetical protein n=1 Tax=Vibrio aerogenes TaxID=92172 RepID=UPI001588298E|nr:hypothetical protein [Vibrio aerogenes]
MRQIFLVNFAYEVSFDEKINTFKQGNDELNKVHFFFLMTARIIGLIRRSCGFPVLSE